ncbi:MAG: MBOAT family O-acyltransferase [Eubacteriales bacterium]|jgi:alginate O-acetyltransferase complex protein AlgI
MVFASISFLFYFLPICILIYFLSPNKLKNAVLLAFSLLFYYFGEQLYVIILLISTILDYTCSLCIERFRGTKKAKIFLIISIVGNLGMLGFFKYYDFFVSNINSFIGISIPLLKVALPIGISFYTFQTMSYTIDVYRGEVPAQKNFLTLFTYVSLFPQLIAGPIVRYQTVEQELENRTHSFDMFGQGVSRFIVGLSKKVVLANQLGLLVEEFRKIPEKTVVFYWLYAIAFTLQIYFDFSGYSDMAIGLGKIFGFNFLENFNYPFISKSVSEFWRRWHMSLGTWFRDYLYIPLGGNRVGYKKWLRNTLVVWLLTGLWHGADWPFVFWGLFVFVFILIERTFLLKVFEKLPSVVSRIYFLIVIITSMVIFNGNGISGSLGDVAAMFGFGGLKFVNSDTIYYLTSNVVLIIIAVIASTPLMKTVIEKLKTKAYGIRFTDIAEPVSCFVLLILSVAYLVDGSFNPFLYFRF